MGGEQDGKKIKGNTDVPVCDVWRGSVHVSLARSVSAADVFPQAL